MIVYIAYICLDSRVILTLFISGTASVIIHKYQHIYVT